MNVIIKSWNGYIWKIRLFDNCDYESCAETVEIERFGTPKSDFPYSCACAKVNDLFEDSEFDPTLIDSITAEGKKLDSGEIGLMVNNMIDFWKLIIQIIEEGEDV